MNKNPKAQAKKGFKESVPQSGPRGGGPGGRFGRKVEKPKDAKKSLKRLLQYLSNSKGVLILLIVFVILYTIAGLYTNILLKRIVGSLGEYDITQHIFTKDPNKDLFITSIITLGIVYVLYCLLQYLSSLLGVYLSVNTVRKLRNDLFSKIVKLPISYIDTHPHGDIMSRMTNDVDNISNAISQSLNSFISGVLTILGCLGIMIWYSPLLTVVSLATLGLTVLLTLFMSKYMRPLFLKQQKILGKLNSQTEEMVTGCKTVIAYNRGPIAIEEFNQSSDELTKTGMKAQIIGGSMGPVMNFIGNIGYFLVCIFGCIFILKGWGNTLLGDPLDISIVVMFLSTSKQFTRPINEIAQIYSSLLTALAGAERVFSILDEPEESFLGTEHFDHDNFKGRIQFEHINFGYTNENPVLKNFDLEIFSGHKIALVGATGSGKTTIVNLLLRFYDHYDGTISIDGIDIKNISKKELRDQISIVLQDPVLFGESIYENVKYGKESATREEVMNALEFADCTSFVEKLPEKENTILTEGASNISQGQRQLLTIARAVLADPKIFILDEATSSVDTRTEKKIQSAMERLMKNRTSLIIAHRLSTIQDADLIVVLDQGHIVEMGNFEELMQLNGKYKKLYMTQYKGIEI